MKKNTRGKHPDNPFQRARWQAGLTQEYAAEQLDCGTRSIQGYEAGRCDPPLPILRKMLELYQCEFADLFPDGTENKPPPARLTNGSTSAELWTEDIATRSVDYRIPMNVSEMRVYNTAHGKSGFYVCPRCSVAMEREFTSFCNYCGQSLSWRGYKTVYKSYYPKKK